MIVSIFVYGRLREFLRDAPSFSVGEITAAPEMAAAPTMTAAPKTETSGSGAPPKPDVLSVLEAFAGGGDGRRLLFDPSGFLRPQILIVVNKKRIPPQKASECRLSDGDEIKVYPAVSGG